MENNEIKTKVEHLLKEISVDKKELNEIRKNCKHSEYDITNDPNIDSYVVKQVCKFCKLAIGYPTNDEMKNAGYTSENEKEED